MATPTMLNRFRGCMLGALLGDCLGSPFEHEPAVGRTHLKNYFAQLLDPSRKMPYKPYTDDTAMTKSLVLSLLECKEYNATDVATRFIKEYFQEPKRGYGSAVHDVFMGLRTSNCEDPYRPAQRLFQGMGSFGNGAAMRVHPIALMYCDNETKAVEIASLQSKITHYHPLGCQGAILQTLAVGLALRSNPKTLDTKTFVDELISKMKEIESKETSNIPIINCPPGEDPESPRNALTYSKRLESVKRFLSMSTFPPLEEIQDVLGVECLALKSVPTAIYCFLASQTPIPGIESDNQIQRCIQLAISLGGDTDTIASMAGAIAGAQLGDSNISEMLLKRVESPQNIISLADSLHEASLKSKSGEVLKDVL